MNAYHQDGDRRLDVINVRCAWFQTPLVPRHLSPMHFGSLESRASIDGTRGWKSFDVSKSSTPGLKWGNDCWGKLSRPWLRAHPRNTQYLQYLFSSLMAINEGLHFQHCKRACRLQQFLFDQKIHVNLWSDYADSSLYVYEALLDVKSSKVSTTAVNLISIFSICKLSYVPAG